MIDVLKNNIIPAALSLLPPKMNSPEAKALLTAICLQESGFKHRQQVGGPAKGLWQWELPQVGLVLRHDVVGPLARDVLAALVYTEGSSPHESIHDAMQHNDILQCAFSRLLLWPDAAPLPKQGDVQGALATYLRVWRPGKPHPEKWPANWAAAWLP
jgi:hypothetical protein